MATDLHVQRNQPPGVPPLTLTGERTLPDVPAENYWFRRHLAVYEWIGARVLGARVIDLACGEGYGSAVLARGAASVLSVDANPEAFDHARVRYVQDNLRFERGLVETHGEPGSFDAVLEPLLVVLTPFAPHFCEELWTALGHQTTVLDAPFPAVEASFLVETTKEYPVSVNGKLRTTLLLDLSAKAPEVEAAVLANEVVQRWLEGRAPKKIIFVPGKMVNVVV